MAEDKAAVYADIMEKARQSIALANKYLFAPEGELKALQPYILAVLQQPEYIDLPLVDIIKLGVDLETGKTIPGSMYDRILKSAENAYLAATGRRFNVKKTEDIIFPVDKVNLAIWNKGIEGNLKNIPIKADKDADSHSLDIMYSVFFDQLEELEKNGTLHIARRLTPFDKRVIVACTALYDAGNQIFSLTQIHYKMGNTATPNTTQLQKIYESVLKMIFTRIEINNTKEAEVYKYPKFIYNGALFPAESLAEVTSVNGKKVYAKYDENNNITEAMIHPFRRSAVIDFAQGRKQVTTFNVRLLQSPLDKRDSNLELEDYLIWRIARAQNSGKKTEKILLNTIYQNCHITSDKQKQRAPEKITRLLEHQKKVDFFKKYKLDKAGGYVLITL